MKGKHMERLSIGDLIELAETGKTGNIELDSMAKAVFSDCLNMLEFEADYYEKERKRREKKNNRIHGA